MARIVAIASSIGKIQCFTPFVSQERHGMCDESHHLSRCCSVNRFEFNLLERSDSGVGASRRLVFLEATCLEVVLASFARPRGMVSACGAAIGEYMEATQKTKDTGDSVFAKKKRKTSQGCDSLMESKTAMVTKGVGDEADSVSVPVRGAVRGARSVFGTVRDFPDVQRAHGVRS